MDKWVAVSFNNGIIKVVNTKEEAKDVIRAEIMKMYHDGDFDYDDVQDALERLEEEDDACDMGVCTLDEWNNL